MCLIVVVVAVVVVVVEGERGMVVDVVGDDDDNNNGEFDGMVNSTTCLLISILNGVVDLPVGFPSFTAASVTVGNTTSNRYKVGKCS